MKDYKRLTERDDSLCIDCAEIGFCRKTCIRQARYERLQLLENEIEDGEIDYVTDRDKEIARLTAENAKLRATLSKMETVEKELKARLEKAVELPTIYEHISYPYIERMYSETIYYVIYKENGRIVTEKFGKNKSKAEARLKELQEKKDD